MGLNKCLDLDNLVEKDMYKPMDIQVTPFY